MNQLMGRAFLRGPEDPLQPVLDPVHWHVDEERQNTAGDDGQEQAGNSLGKAQDGR